MIYDQKYFAHTIQHTRETSFLNQLERLEIQKIA